MIVEYIFNANYISLLLVPSFLNENTDAMQFILKSCRVYFYQEVSVSNRNACPLSIAHCWKDAIRTIAIPQVLRLSYDVSTYIQIKATNKKHLRPRGGVYKTCFCENEKRIFYVPSYEFVRRKKTTTTNAANKNRRCENGEKISPTAFLRRSYVENQQQEAKTHSTSSIVLCLP